MRSCYVCQSGSKELRPYGVGGQDICFDCMTSSPEREAEAERIFTTLLGANDVLGNGLVEIGGQDGPSPFEIPQ